MLGIVAILLFCALILAFCIGRTYKLSLISTESQLQSLLIQTNGTPNFLQKSLRHLQKSENRRISRLSSHALRRFHCSDSHIMLNQKVSRKHRRHLQRAKSDLLHQPSASELKMDDEEYSGTIERRNSFWKQVGNHIVHVHSNGQTDFEDDIV